MKDRLTATSWLASTTGHGPPAAGCGQLPVSTPTRRSPPSASRHNSPAIALTVRRHLFTLKSVIANPSSLSVISGFVALQRVGKPYLGS